MRDAYYDSYNKVEKEHWWFRVRREMVHFFIKKYKGCAGHLRILDMGCGTGVLLSELGTYGEAEGMDFSPKAVAFCKERGLENVTLGRGESMPFQSESFDVSLALDVIEHIEDDERAVAELYRVTKPGGVAIIFVPAFMFLWGVTDEVSQHFRRYTKPELKEKLRAAGFSVERSTYFNFVLFLPILLVRTINNLLPKHLQPENETEMSGGMMNGILYLVFKLESIMLRYINLPFGVSLAVVCRKP